MVHSRRNKQWSWWATNFCVAAIAFAIGVAANWAWNLRCTPRTQPTPVAPPPPPQPIAVDLSSADIGTLKRDILEAKARGDNKVELSLIGCGWEIGSLRSALARNTVVVAEVVGKKTYESTFGLYTWYRFKIRETLIEHKPPRLRYSPFGDGPSDMLPVAEDEFLIQEVNGQMEIDGVTVTQHSNGAKYREGQTYLLFVLIDPSKRIAIGAGTDALGVFLVDNEGNLTSYNDDPYSFKTEMAKRFNNSLDNMREALKPRTRTSPTRR